MAEWGLILSLPVLMMTAGTSCKSSGAPETPETVNPAERLATRINYKCPHMVDVDTRLDSVSIMPDSTFRYDYTLVNQDVETLDVVGLTAYIGNKLLETVSTTSTMKLHRDLRLRMMFYYRDRKGDYVTQIVIGPEHYQ